MTSNQKSILRMKIFKWGTRILLIIIAIIMLFPLIWNIYSAFKTNTEFLSNPFSLPSGLEWDNFARAIQKSDLGANILVRGFGNISDFSGLCNSLFVLPRAV